MGNSIRIQDKIKLLLYYTETRYVKLLRKLGFKSDVLDIPIGQYCYVVDVARNTNEPCSNGEYWIKTCKYYRSTTSSGGIACTYIGHYGFDPCLRDQCKICGKNY
jgi:hypothetical protein